MTVYNGMPYLPVALDSILRQTFRDFELVVVDDASTDRSNEIIVAYARNESRIRVLTNPANLGIAGALNIGVEAARGEYIAIMDDDDISLPQRFQRQVEFLDLHPDHILVGCSYDIIDADGRVQKTARYPVESWRVDWLAHFRNPVGHPTAMYRGWLVREGGLRYDRQYQAAADTDFLMRALGFGKAANLPSPLVQYRMHNANMSTRSHHLQFEEASQIAFGHLLTRYPHLAGQEWLLRQICRFLYFRDCAVTWRMSEAAATILLIQSNFAATRNLSTRDSRRINRITARLLGEAALRAGLGNMLDLIWTGRPYRRLLLTEAIKFISSRSLDVIRRSRQRLTRSWSENGAGTAGSL